MYCLLLFIILLFILHSLTPHKHEGYINNKVDPDHPDPTQFYACHDHSNKNVRFGNNNYKVKKHSIKEPQKGPYSAFLDVYDLRNYDEVFHAPICEKKYSFDDIHNLDEFRPIIDHDDALQEDKLLKEEEELDNNAIKDPFYPYYNPNHIQNKILYSDEINKVFLRNHLSHVEELKHDNLH
tara:strand:+ start:145 stop:687 length:543 start_codon:yes stop_codon:yes gene_type:complete